jgi:catechol 2,3-dioxygenase-like lactoylglutathione lyase family enzyme
MATLSAINNERVSGASAAKVDMKFEVIVIPVADVDHSKAFYTKLGWTLDADFPFDNEFWVVQFTPPGSGCRAGLCLRSLPGLIEETARHDESYTPIPLKRLASCQIEGSR